MVRPVFLAKETKKLFTLSIVVFMPDLRFS
jgi:hypothetical protein